MSVRSLHNTHFWVSWQLHGHFVFPVGDEWWLHDVRPWMSPCAGAPQKECYWMGSPRGLREDEGGGRENVRGREGKCQREGGKMSEGGRRKMSEGGREGGRGRWEEKCQREGGGREGGREAREKGQREGGKNYKGVQLAIHIVLPLKSRVCSSTSSSFW